MPLFLNQAPVQTRLYRLETLFELFGTFSQSLKEFEEGIIPQNRNDQLWLLDSLIDLDGMTFLIAEILRNVKLQQNKSYWLETLQDGANTQSQDLQLVRLHRW